MTPPDWIAIDWGTSRLRAWALNSNGEILARAESDEGMSAMQDSASFEPTLLSLLSPWLSDSQTIPVFGCGMVGSQQGWIDAPYAKAPCAPATTPLPAPVTDNRIAVSICPGVCQMNPADVMRGEETQIAGLLSVEPDFEGTVCLPGTHSKWAQIESGLLQTFSTFLTGELFSLLADQSVLRHTVGKEGWEKDTFLEALEKGVKEPSTISSRLFSLRAEALLHGESPSAARARLSGYLIGWELGASETLWRDRSVTLIGETKLAACYASALRHFGNDPRILDSESMTLAGLSTARERTR